jgi:hypothetical protein
LTLHKTLLGACPGRSLKGLIGRIGDKNATARLRNNLDIIRRFLPKMIGLTLNDKISK